MKKFLLLAWAVIAVFSLNSCSKDDEDPNDPKPQEMRYVKAIRWDDGATYSYEYDDQMRCSKLTYNDSHSKNVYTYSYGENTISVEYTETTPTSSEVSTLVTQLDANGRALSTMVKEPTGTTYNIKYSYDADGHLISNEYIEDDGTNLYTYIWFNDNLVDYTYEMNSWSYNTTPVKPTNIDINAILMSYMGWEWTYLSPYIGKRSVNWVEKEYDSPNGSIQNDLTVYYTYTFDEKGYPIKVVSCRIDGKYPSTCEIAYY